MRSIPTLVAASLATFLPAQDPAASLDIGDPGPPWTVDTWLHGPELSALQRDTFYYVEFWATWCAPCVASFPELSALQEAHASDRLVVVGISIDREKTADELKQFAKDQVARGRVRYAL